MPLGAILGITSLGSGIASAIGASSAANAGANAANNATNVERQNAIDALNFQKQVYGDQQRNIAPWLNNGTAAINQLGKLMGLNVPSAPQPNWNAPAFTGGSLGDLNGIRALLNRGGGGNGAVAMNAQGGAVPMSAQGSTVPMSGGSSVPITGGATPMNGGGTSPILNSILPGEGGNPGGVNMSTGGDGSQAPIVNDAQGNPLPSDFGSLAKPFGESFTAPTDVTEQNDPGFKFRLDQGMKALQNSAAARGGLLSGGTAKALNDYAQGSASNEYGNVYNRALGEFQQRYNIFNNDQNTLFNRLAALSGAGQTSAANLNSAGSNAAGNIGNILLTSGGQIGNNINNAGAARGSGYVGVGNAIGGSLSNLGNLALLAKLYGGGGSPFNTPSIYGSIGGV